MQTMGRKAFFRFRDGRQRYNNETNKVLVIPAKCGLVPKVVMLSKAQRGTLDSPRKKGGKEAPGKSTNSNTAKRGNTDKLNKPKGRRGVELQKKKKKKDKHGLTLIFRMSPYYLERKRKRKRKTFDSYIQRGVRKKILKLNNRSSDRTSVQISLPVEQNKGKTN